MLERRRTDELLRQRQLFEKAPGFIAILRGPNHVYEFVNDAYVRVVGARNYIGKPVREVVPEAESQGFVQLLDTVYKSAKRHVAQHQRILLQPRADQPPEEHYVDFVYEPMLNSAGDTTAIFVEGCDVTQRIDLASAAGATGRATVAGDQRDRAWANSRDLLVVIDADGVFRAVSPAWTQVLGHTVDTVLGRRFRDFVAPADARQTETSLSAPTLATFENRMLRTDGTPRWIAWHTSADGGLVYAYGRDVTQEKLASTALAMAESRLRAIFETSYLFQGLLTPFGMVLDANNTALSAIGQTLDHVSGKMFWDTPWFAGTPELAQSVKKGIQAAAAGHVVRQEIHVNLPVGGWRWFDFALRPVRDSAGVVVAIVPEAQELTERKLAEAALHQSQKLEAMGQLTGGVAHDFNNLLLPIIGSLDMLQRRGIGSEREQRLIGNALKSAERAKVLVQRLLAFARRQPLQPVPVQIDTMIDEIKGLLASSTGPHIVIHVDIEADLPAANADPTQLQKALVNLSVNARDAMPQGGTLTLSAHGHDIDAAHHTSLPPGRYVCLAVTDTGKGMDAATLARAIEPFFSTKGVGRGTGLGLSMVHGLASQLGGALSISSDIGKGTRVELWLPVSSVPAETSAAGKPAVGATLISGTALLVEDEEMIRLTTADMLTELGCTVIEASTASDALAILRGGAHIDILITDHLMPGMTGVDLAQIALREQPAMPVLIVSGFAEVDALPAHLPRLPKPFRQADLGAALHHLLGRKTLDGVTPPPQDDRAEPPGAAPP